jgi:hypothetical protein
MIVARIVARAVVMAEELMIRTPADLLLLALADGTLQGPAAAGDTVDVNLLDQHYIYGVVNPQELYLRMNPSNSSLPNLGVGATEERGSTE